jgi:hypothetical protein
MRFIIRNKITGLGIAEYEAAEAKAPYEIDVAYSGDGYVTFDEAGNEVVLANNFKVWTILEFKRRMTQTERVTVRTLAKTEPVIEDFMDLLDAATEVRSDDPDLAAGLNMLESVGVLTAGRTNEILNGE